MGKNAWITGKALVCSLGDSIPAILAAVRGKEIRPHLIPFALAGLPSSKPYFLISRYAGDLLENRNEAYYYELLYETVSRALEDAGLNSREIGDTHIFFGSTSMDVPVFEGNHGRRPETVAEMFLRSSCGYGKIANALAARIGAAGNCYSFSMACTSSANAFLYAASLIEAGEIGRAVVVGYDLFNNLTYFGFEALKSLAASDCRPFDRDRGGLILGEACSAVVLEGERRREGDFRYLGGANLCDTFSVTSNDPGGGAAAETMARALRRANIDAECICAVKAHATGTENNDQTECVAMRAVFGKSIPPVTCLKPYMGHTLGACGVSELVLFTEAVREGFLPATPGFRERDRELNFVPLTDNLDVGRGFFMMNYFGFGGNCTSLIVSNGE